MAWVDASTRLYFPQTIIWTNFASGWNSEIENVVHYQVNGNEYTDTNDMGYAGTKESYLSFLSTYPRVQYQITEGRTGWGRRTSSGWEPITEPVYVTFPENPDNYAGTKYRLQNYLDLGAYWENEIPTAKIVCTVTTIGTGFTVDISPTDNCTVANGVVTVTDETAEASFSVEFFADAGYSITDIDWTASPYVNVLEDGNSFAVSFNTDYGSGVEQSNTLEFTVTTTAGNIEINITSNGTTTLATAGKFCDRNIDVNVNVPQAEPIEVSTAAAMNALLVAGNVGKVYKFTGITDSTYTNGDLYEVVNE